jgi:hypothetical protein
VPVCIGSGAGDGAPARVELHRNLLEAENKDWDEGGSSLLQKLTGSVSSVQRSMCSLSR